MTKLDTYLSAKNELIGAYDLSPHYAIDDMRDYYWSIKNREITFASQKQGNGESFTEICLEYRKVDHNLFVVKMLRETFDEISWCFFLGTNKI